MKVTKRSRLSGKEHTLEIDVTQEQLDDWKREKKLVQVAFPHLTSDEREFLISGITPEEWAKAFPDD